MQSKPFKASFFRNLEAIDLYGQDFFLPVNTNKRYSTKLGMIFTFVTFALMISYGIYKGKVFLDMSSYQVISSTLAKQINYTDPEIVDFVSLGFDLSFSTTQPLPQEIGRLELAIVEATFQIDETTQKTIRKFTSYPQLLVKCSNESFNTTGLTKIEDLAISNYSCIANKSEIKIGGTAQANLFRYLNVNLYLCENSTNSTSSVQCASPEEQKEFFRLSALQFKVRNQYFDSADNEQAIKSYLDERFIMPVVLEQQSIGYFPLRKSQAQIQGRFPWQTDTIIDFAQAQPVITYQAMDGFHYSPAKISINFFFDFFTDIYQKQQYTLMDYLSEVGGLFNSILFLGKITTIVFVTNSYLAYIASHLYFVDGQVKATEDELVQNAMQKIVNTERIKAGLFIQMKYFLCCVFLRKINYKDFKAKKPEALLEHAKDKFCQEFDLIEVLKSLQELRSLKNHLLSRSEQILLSFQHQFYLDDSLKPLQELELTRKIISKDPITKGLEIQQFCSNLLSRIEGGQVSDIGINILKGVVNIEDERSQIIDRKSIFGTQTNPHHRSADHSQNRKEERKVQEAIGFKKKKIKKDPSVSKKHMNEFFKDNQGRSRDSKKTNERQKKEMRLKRAVAKEYNPLS